MPSSDQGDWPSSGGIAMPPSKALGKSRQIPPPGTKGAARGGAGRASGAGAAAGLAAGAAASRAAGDPQEGEGEEEEEEEETEEAQMCWSLVFSFGPLIWTIMTEFAAEAFESVCSGPARLH